MEPCKTLELRNRSFSPSTPIYLSTSPFFEQIFPDEVPAYGMEAIFHAVKCLECQFTIASIQTPEERPHEFHPAYL
jgi:hypothetical protein